MHKEKVNQKAGTEISPKAVFIRIGNMLERVPIDELLWVQSDGNYCNIHSKNKKYVTKKSLVKLANLLPSQDFIRIHMKYMVRLEVIKKISLAENKVFIENVTLDIGPSYRSKLLNMLNII